MFHPITKKRRFETSGEEVSHRFQRQVHFVKHLNPTVLDHFESFKSLSLHDEYLSGCYQVQSRVLFSSSVFQCVKNNVPVTPTVVLPPAV